MSGTLIIGGTRFMGYLVVSNLLAAGEQVTILNRGKHPDPFGERVERLHADRTTPNFGRILMGRDFDAVVDFSAYNARDAKSAIDALKNRTGHYIFISSGAVYMVQEGAALPCTSPWSESQFTGRLSQRPTTPDDLANWEYGAGKHNAETILAQAWHETRFPVTCLRLPIVNGIRDPERRLESYLWRIADGGPVLLPNGGTNPIRHVYCEDVAQAIVGLRGQRHALGEAFNLSQDEELTVAEMVKILADLLGTPHRLQPITAAQLVQAGLSSRNVSPFSGKWSSRLDPTRAQTALGFRHQPLVRYLKAMVTTWLSNPPVTPPTGYLQRQQELSLT